MKKLFEFERKLKKSTNEINSQIWLTNNKIDIKSWYNDHFSDRILGYGDTISGKGRRKFINGGNDGGKGQGYYSGFRNYKEVEDYV